MWRHSLNVVALALLPSLCLAWTKPVQEYDNNDLLVTNFAGLSTVETISHQTWDGTNWVSSYTTTSAPYLSMITHEMRPGQSVTNVTEGFFGAGWLAPGARWYTNVTISTAVETNLVLVGSDIVSWESYLAAVERHQALFGTNFVHTNVHAGRLWMAAPRFYRGERDNLLAAKSWISAVCAMPGNPDFSWRGWLSGAENEWRTFVKPDLIPRTNIYNYGGWSNPGIFMEWTNRLEFLADCGLPTNWFDATPWRWLDGRGRCDDRVMETTWQISTRAAGFVTNVTWDSCGNVVTNIGTNGQVFTRLCTNDWILSGHTSCDYGWAGVTAAMSRLVVVERAGLYEGQVLHFRVPDGGFEPSCSVRRPEDLDWRVDANEISYSGFNAQMPRQAMLSMRQQAGCFYEYWKYNTMTQGPWVSTNSSVVAEMYITKSTGVFSRAGPACAAAVYIVGQHYSAAPQSHFASLQSRDITDCEYIDGVYVGGGYIVSRWTAYTQDQTWAVFPNLESPVTPVWSGRLPPSNGVVRVPITPLHSSIGAMSAQNYHPLSLTKSTSKTLSCFEGHEAEVNGTARGEWAQHLFDWTVDDAIPYPVLIQDFRVEGGFQYR